MMRILSVSEMRAVELTSDMTGHTYAQMMALAGQAVARAILRRVSVRGRRVLVLVGPGNNGGDGLVAARLLCEAEAHVTVYLARERDPAEDAVFRQVCEHGDARVLTAEADCGLETLRHLTAQTHVIIDALLGTGATPPLRGTLAQIIESVQATLTATRRSTLSSLNGVPKLPPARPYIVAVDGPSGLDFDTGEIAARALKAHLTVTFAAPKWGHLRFPGAGYVGELTVADIGIPENIDIPGDGPEMATMEDARAWLPPRPLDAHKGTFGKAMIVAGSVNYPGAAGLAAQAATRSGAGLTTLAAPGLIQPALIALSPETTHIPLPHSMGMLDAQAATLLLEKIKGYTALLVGPGLNRNAETLAFMRRLLGLNSRKRNPGFIPLSDSEETASPPALSALVIDADGLNLLSEIEGWPQYLPEGTVLTPHPGEMARLVGESAEADAMPRWKLAREKAREWGQVVLLKSAFSVVAAPDGRAMILPFANPGLSSAGTGDVLAGVIVALRAQGLGAFEAAVAGAYVHGLAGEVARQSLGVVGMTASDVVSALPEAWQRIAGQ